ncbi:hypothetical protein Are01nite_81210 [Actinoplanes regularis]|nr:hypothetical protein Are01nite_81210 [Actinoplanes regularis]
MHRSIQCALLRHGYIPLVSGSRGLHAFGQLLNDSGESCVVPSRQFYFRLRTNNGMSVRHYLQEPGKRGGNPQLTNDLRRLSFDYPRLGDWPDIHSEAAYLVSG